MSAKEWANVDPTLLETLAAQYPSADLALGEIAAMHARLSLPKPVTHVISDVHGEFGKLRHVINNASGTLRPLVERIFKGRLESEDLTRFLAVLYYPHELHCHIREELSDSDRRRRWVGQTLRRQMEVVRELARGATTPQITALVPAHFRRLFSALIKEPYSGRGAGYSDLMIEVFRAGDLDLDAVRAASRLVRNLAVGEIVVAGDMGDRGPRIDRVIGYLMQQPNVAVTWGNHDASWMGACLGCEALIATVLRISLRYHRLVQLEEGYGIRLLALEQFARKVYCDDPAECFRSRDHGLRDAALMARMQKATAVLQFKLEGQLIQRHPEWKLEHRMLLHRLSPDRATVEIDGVVHAMLDTWLPTVDPDDPYRLSPEEDDCMRRLRESFVSSGRLWEHMKFLSRRGGMSLVRDDTVIFHGCVPVDGTGHWESIEIHGVPVAGHALFTAFDTLVRHCFRRGAEEAGVEADWFWYLWCGPRSPLFGKNRITTFENYFVGDAAARRELKNPYYGLINDSEFVRRVATEIGGDADRLVVNGHVAVKVEAGEDPLKRGGNAVTIDGAFSEATGDRGYTLLLTSESIQLAAHQHFDGVDGTVLEGADMVPDFTAIRTYDRPRRVADTEEGVALQARIRALEALMRAYEEGRLFERG